MDICQRIITTKDTNGNTRAIWLAYSIGEQVEVPIGQGYLETGGNRPRQLRGWVTLPGILIPPGKFQDMVRDLKRHGKLTI